MTTLGVLTACSGLGQVLPEDCIIQSSTTPRLGYYYSRSYDVPPNPILQRPEELHMVFRLLNVFQADMGGSSYPATFWQGHI